jgi:thiol-activated cytolysin
MAKADVGTFIASLTYDPRVVLSVVADGETSALPVKTRQDVSNGVIICTSRKHTLNKNLDEVAILSPTAGVIFPGAMLLADQNMMDGKPTPISLPRDPATLSIDLPGLSKPSQQVAPTNSAVLTFLNSILEEWNKQAKSEGYENAARSILQVTKSYTSQQVALDLGFNAKWASGSASSQLGVASSSEKSVLVAYFKQVFYTITMDTPVTPASVFSNDVTVEQAKAVFSNEHPPGYVRSVDYGRILLVKMEYSNVDTSVKLKAAFDYATGSASGGGKTDSSITNIVKNSTFQVLAIGGGAQAAMKMFTGSSDESLKGLAEYIQNGAGYRRDNPGLPIAYTVVFLKDNQFARMGNTTDYTEVECVRYNMGFVKFDSYCGYVMKFEVTWDAPDDKGDYAHKSWESGKQTSGYSHTLELPGDAKNIHLQAEADTGLAWSPWGEILNLRLDGPNNKTYTVKGTTLNRWYDVSPP